MTLQEIIDKKITNGRFFAIEAKTEKKGLKDIRFVKRATVTAQFGCNYDNLAAVQAMGERDSSRPSWFEHTEYDSIVRHKKNPEKLYLQIMNPRSCHVTYTLADGTPVTRSQLIAMGAIKDEPNEKPLTLLYALDSILAITYKENNKEAMAA